MQKTQSKDPRMAGMAWLVPALTVRDVAKAMDFYEKAFGFEKGFSMPGPDGRIVHGDMRYKGSVIIMMGLEGAQGNLCKAPVTMNLANPPAGLYVYCDDVDALCAKAKKAGAIVKTEPADMFWGDRMTALTDPEGYSWMFAKNVRPFDPTKVPKN